MRGERGFTLLEVMVASLVMAVAVAGLLASLSTSLRNGARVTDSDRAAACARAKMGELILQAKLPHNQEVGGLLAGWPEAGWRAVVQAWEVPPGAAPGSPILERIQLEVWWNSPGGRRSFPLENYRAGRMLPGDVPVQQQP
jgi:general secretion pathway protein I